MKAFNSKRKRTLRNRVAKRSLKLGLISYNGKGEGLTVKKFKTGFQLRNYRILFDRHHHLECLKNFFGGESEFCQRFGLKSSKQIQKEIMKKYGWN